MKASSSTAEAARQQTSRSAVRSCCCATRAEDDAPALYRLGVRIREVTRFFSWGPYTDESEAATYVRSLDAQACATASGWSS